MRAPLVGAMFSKRATAGSIYVRILPLCLVGFGILSYLEYHAVLMQEVNKLLDPSVGAFGRRAEMSDILQKDTSSNESDVATIQLSGNLYIP
jgi:hypothetical protein